MGLYALTKYNRDTINDSVCTFMRGTNLDPLKSAQISPFPAKDLTMVCTYFACFALREVSFKLFVMHVHLERFSLIKLEKVKLYTE